MMRNRCWSGRRGAWRGVGSRVAGGCVVAAGVAGLAAPAAAVHWEGSSNNLWSDPDSWSTSVPTSGTVDFDAFLGPASPQVNVDLDVDLTSLNFKDWEIAAGIIQDMNAQFFGVPTQTFETFIMNFEPSGSPFDEGRTSATFNNMDMRVDHFDFDRGFVGELFNRGQIRMTLENNTQLRVVNAGDGRIDGLFGTIPEGNVVANKFVLTIKDGSVMDNVRLGGLAPPQYPLVLGPGSELRLSGGGEMGWWAVSQDDAALVVGTGGGRITADFSQTGPVLLNASNLTFGGPDPFFPSPPDPLTNVDRDPNAGNELFAFLVGQVTGPGGIQVDHPLYTVRLSNGSNDFTGDIRIFSGTLRAASGPSLGALGKEIEFFNGTYRPDDGFNTALAMRFLQGGTGTIDTSEGDHAVTRPWSGDGTFRKAGENTLALSRDGSGFGGDYLVSEGTLLIPEVDAVRFFNELTIEAGGTARFAADNKMEALHGDGTLEVDAGRTATFNGLGTIGAIDLDGAADFAGNVTGTGTVELDGFVGVQRFSGDNTGFAGRFVVRSGIMIFSSPEAAPDAVSINGGLLIHDGGGTHTGEITGAVNRVFEKRGDNTLALDGTYANFFGITRIAEGTLEVAQNTVLRSEVFVNDAQLPDFLPPAGGVLTGDGFVRAPITVLDGGVVTGELDTEDITIESGGIVNGERNFRTGDIVVRDGGRLTGDVTAQDITVEAGGLLDPEYDPGNFGVEVNINADGFTLDPGGVLEIDVTRVQGFRDSTVLFLDGVATLGGTLRVAIDPDFPLLNSETVFFINAAEINGAFENIAFGERIETIGGEGSFLLERVSAPGGRFSAELTDYQAIAAALIGDYNASGLVEQGDLNQVLNNWGAAFDAVSASWIDQRPTEGIVDQAELNAVLNNWGASAAPAFGGVSVPEPGAAALLALAGLSVWGRRRGRMSDVRWHI